MLLRKEPRPRARVSSSLSIVTHVRQRTRCHTPSLSRRRYGQCEDLALASCRAQRAILVEMGGDESRGFATIESVLGQPRGTGSWPHRRWKLRLEIRVSRRKRKIAACRRKRRQSRRLRDGAPAPLKFEFSEGSLFGVPLRSQAITLFTEALTLPGKKTRRFFSHSPLNFESVS